MKTILFFFLNLTLLFGAGVFSASNLLANTANEKGYAAYPITTQTPYLLWTNRTRKDLIDYIDKHINNKESLYLAKFSSLGNKFTNFISNVSCI